MARQAGPDGAALLNEVERLAGEGYGKAEIAQQLGFKNPSTFNARLVKASQRTGKPIPGFKALRRAAQKKRVESVRIAPRGKGQSFGVNIPQEPLERLGAMPGDILSVNVSRHRIVLAIQHEDEAAPATSGPRLVKNRKRR